MKPWTLEYLPKQRILIIHRRDTRTGGGCTIKHYRCSPARRDQLADRLRKQLTR